MEDIEKVEKAEQLVKKTGCSYGEAKAALERHGWNTLDALIDLEEGRATFVESEVIDRNDAHKYQSADFNMNPNEKHFRDIGADGGASRNRDSERKGGVRDFFTRLWGAVTKNYLNLYSKSDKLLLHIPVIIPVIFFLIWFWLMLGLSVVLLILGFRFQFEGSDLGRSTINSAMDSAASAAYSAGQRVKAEFSSDPENRGGFRDSASGSGADPAAGSSTGEGDTRYYGDRASNN